jgi:hypothetical protein
MLAAGDVPSSKVGMWEEIALMSLGSMQALLLRGTLNGAIKRPTEKPNQKAVEHGQNL